MGADFGISRFVSVNGEHVEATYEGSLRWMSIELIRSLMSGSGAPTHTKASDVWAFGMVLFVSNRIFQGEGVDVLTYTMR